jgi:hypothetical protein
LSIFASQISPRRGWLPVKVRRLQALDAEISPHLLLSGEWSHAVSGGQLGVDLGFVTPG